MYLENSSSLCQLELNTYRASNPAPADLPGAEAEGGQPGPDSLTSIAGLEARPTLPPGLAEPTEGQSKEAPASMRLGTPPGYTARAHTPPEVHTAARALAGLRDRFQLASKAARKRRLRTEAPLHRQIPSRPTSARRHWAVTQTHRYDASPWDSTRHSCSRQGGPQNATGSLPNMLRLDDDDDWASVRKHGRGVHWPGMLPPDIGRDVGPANPPRSPRGPRISRRAAPKAPGGDGVQQGRSGRARIARRRSITRTWAALMQTGAKPSRSGTGSPRAGGRPANLAQAMQSALKRPAPSAGGKLRATTSDAAARLKQELEADSALSPHQRTVWLKAHGAAATARAHRVANLLMA
ncbi:hypothetical protein WJX84_001468 [Apatococcus fuscideae]|uniref:Uncharacterized protein n=1 Tax=Apatococcus fuscideae TaxID=2026836 RepID=A0AAW1RVQ8_9CHLO